MFRGSIVALVTPMGANGELDLAGLERLVDFHVAEGTDGLVIAGTTGESPTLEADELETLVARAVAAADGRIPVIGGSGTNSTARTIELSRRVARAGAAAALVVTPYYNKPVQAGLAAHYRAVADASDVPVVLYNVPGRTACDLAPETAAGLAAHGNIVGLKEAVPEPSRWQALKELCPEDFCLLSGDDATAMDFIAAGGQGVVSVTANVAPRLMHGLCEAALRGENRKAASINDRLEQLHGAMFLESSPIPVKWAVSQLGLIGEGIRLPLTRLAQEFEAPLLAAMRTAGIEPAR
jgi:4-hydroxy-tetrahydrodipicolinate synthase